MTCLKLAKDKKYSEIDGFWKVSPLCNIEVTEVQLSQLETFSWANLEML